MRMLIKKNFAKKKENDYKAIKTNENILITETNDDNKKSENRRITFGTTTKKKFKMTELLKKVKIKDTFKKIKEIFDKFSKIPDPEKEKKISEKKIKKKNKEKIENIKEKKFSDEYILSQSQKKNKEKIKEKNITKKFFENKEKNISKNFSENHLISQSQKKKMTEHKQKNTFLKNSQDYLLSQSQKKKISSSNTFFPSNYQNYHFYLFLYYYIINQNLEEIYENYINFSKISSGGVKTLQFEQNAFATFLKENEKNLGSEIFFKIIKFYDKKLYNKLFVIQKMIKKNVDIKLTNFIILKLYSEFSNSELKQKNSKNRKLELPNICYKKFLPLSLSFFFINKYLLFCKREKIFFEKLGINLLSKEKNNFSKNISLNFSKSSNFENSKIFEKKKNSNYGKKNLFSNFEEIIGNSNSSYCYISLEEIKDFIFFNKEDLDFNINDFQIKNIFRYFEKKYEFDILKKYEQKKINIFEILLEINYFILSFDSFNKIEMDFEKKKNNKKNLNLYQILFFDDNLLWKCILFFSNKKKNIFLKNLFFDFFFEKIHIDNEIIEITQKEFFIITENFYKKFFFFISSRKILKIFLDSLTKFGIDINNKNFLILINKKKLKILLNYFEESTNEIIKNNFFELIEIFFEMENFEDLKKKIDEEKNYLNFYKENFLYDFKKNIKNKNNVKKILILRKLMKKKSLNLKKKKNEKNFDHFKKKKNSKKEENIFSNSKNSFAISDSFVSENSEYNSSQKNDKKNFFNLNNTLEIIKEEKSEISPKTPRLNKANLGNFFKSSSSGNDSEKNSEDFDNKNNILNNFFKNSKNENSLKQNSLSQKKFSVLKKNSLKKNSLLKNFKKEKNFEEEISLSNSLSDFSDDFSDNISYDYQNTKINNFIKFSSENNFLKKEDDNNENEVEENFEDDKKNGLFEKYSRFNNKSSEIQSVKFDEDEKDENNCVIF